MVYDMSLTGLCLKSSLIIMLIKRDNQTLDLPHIFETVQKYIIKNRYMVYIFNIGEI